MMTTERFWKKDSSSKDTDLFVFSPGYFFSSVALASACRCCIRQMEIPGLLSAAPPHSDHTMKQTFQKLLRIALHPQEFWVTQRNIRTFFYYFHFSVSFPLNLPLILLVAAIRQ